MHRRSFFVWDVPQCYVNQRVERHGSLKVARSEESNIKATVLWMVWLKCYRHRKCWTDSINAGEHCILLPFTSVLIDVVRACAGQTFAQNDTPPHCTILCRLSCHFQALHADEIHLILHTDKVICHLIDTSNMFDWAYLLLLLSLQAITERYRLPCPIEVIRVATTSPSSIPSLHVQCNEIYYICCCMLWSGHYKITRLKQCFAASRILTSSSIFYR